MDDEQSDDCMCGYARAMMVPYVSEMYTTGSVNQDDNAKVISESLKRIIHLSHSDDEYDMDEYNALFALVTLAMFTHWTMSDQSVCDIVARALNVELPKYTHVDVEKVLHGKQG